MLILTLGCGSSPDSETPDANVPDANTPDAELPDAELPEGKCATNEHCGEAEYCALEPDACGIGSCVPVLEPTPAPGTVYEAWEMWPCVADSCNCSPGAAPLYEGLFRCEPIHNGFFWTFGSVEIRVAGRDASGDCIWEISDGMEGEFQQTTCRVPMPAKPWPGLFGDYSYESPFWEGFPGTCDEPTSCCNRRLPEPLRGRGGRPARLLPLPPPHDALRLRTLTARGPERRALMRTRTRTRTRETCACACASS